MIAPVAGAAPRDATSRQISGDNLEDDLVDDVDDVAPAVSDRPKKRPKASKDGKSGSAKKTKQVKF